MSLVEKVNDCVEFDFQQEEKHNHFKCPICHQFMIMPVQLNCQTITPHIIGANCIFKWILKSHAKNCVLCKNAFITTEISANLVLAAQDIKTQCKDCEKSIRIQDHGQHLKQCKEHQTKLRKQLQTIISSEIESLEAQITPHLRQKHEEIFNTHVRDWIWLKEDPRDWKWWWWASNPWWSNTPCLECNVLWHKYEHQIEIFEQRRKNILGELQEIKKEQ